MHSAYCYGDVAGWVAGLVGGYPSHAGIVSKWLNLSLNFFDHLVAPLFYAMRRQKIVLVLTFEFLLTVM